MNLQNILIRVVALSLAINVSAKVGRAEPHGATSRISDRSLSSSTGETEYRLARMTNEANLALIEGQFDLAISRCTTILGQRPDKKIATVAYELRSEAYANKHQYQQSLVDAESAIKIDPSSPYGYIARGVLRYRTDKYKLALTDFDEAIRRNPKGPDGYLQRGTCYDLLGDGEHAISDYTQAIRCGLPRGGAHYNRGLLFLQKHNYKAALSDLNIAVNRGRSIEPSLYADALAAVASLKATCPDAAFRDGKKAVELATRACEISKWTMPYSIRALAAAYAECGDFDRAIKYETQAINTPDLDADTTKNQKKSYAEAQRKELRLLQEHKPIRGDFKRPAL
jgi:tetratricopeptide (TPR) repeat protein